MFQKNIIKQYLLFGMFLFFWTSTFLFAQNTSFTYQHFGVEDGLSSDLIRCVFKDSRNLLWIGTKDTGLNIYDGTKFQPFPLITQDGQNPSFDNGIAVISEDALGRIWVGTNIGVFIISIEDNQTILLPIELENGQSLSITGITKAKDGNMWMISTETPYLIKANTQLEVQLFPSPSSNARGNTFILEDKNGFLWTRGKEEGTLVKTTKEGIQTIINVGLTSNPELALSPENDLIIVPMHTKRLMLLDEKESKLIPYQSDTHQISDDFINQLKSKTTNYYDNFQLYFIVQQLLFDANETVWIATFQGLFVMQAHRKNLAFKTIPELSGKHLRLILPVSDDEFYVSANKTLYEWNRGTHQLKAIKDGIEVWTLVPFQGDSMLLTLAGEHFFMFDTTTKKVDIFQPKIEGGGDILGENYITIKDNEGIIRSGRYVFNGLDSVSQIRDCEGNILNRFTVYAMIEDQDGVIWMGTSLGLYKIDGCEVSSVALSASANQIKINGLYERNKNEIIVGTKNQGVYHYHKKKGLLNVFNTQNGLSDNQTCSILSNNATGIWVSTYHGLNYIDLNRKHIQSFFEQDGVANNEFNRNSACQLSSGELLFGGMKGCTVIPPNIKLPEPHFPDLHITSYSKINKQTRYFEKFFFDTDKHSVSLKPDENYLEFSFASSDFVNNKNIKFAHYLEGIDEDWIYCESNMTARYSNLDAGNYRFLVKMKPPSGDWILSENHVDLEVEQYFYKSNYFKGLIIGLILLVIGTFLYQYIANQRQIAKIKQKLASDLHDDIGSALNGIYKIIKNLKQTQKETNIDFELDTIAKLGNGVISRISDVIWSIKSDSSEFQDLMERIEDFADDIFPALPYEYTIKSENIKPNAIIDFNTKYQLLLICKEGLNNVIKHSAEGKVELILRNEKKQFILHLKNEYPQKIKPKNSNGLGLKSIKNRAAVLNATVQFKENDHSFAITLTMRLFC